MILSLYQTVWSGCTRPNSLVQLVLPRDGTATRERILDAAEQLVIDNGFAATSVDQVIAESGTPRGFFHHFELQARAGDALVDRYVAADLAHLQAGCDAAPRRATTPRSE